MAYWTTRDSTVAVICCCQGRQHRPPLRRFAWSEVEPAPGFEPGTARLASGRCGRLSTCAMTCLFAPSWRAEEVIVFDHSSRFCVPRVSVWLLPARLSAGALDPGTWGLPRSCPRSAPGVGGHPPRAVLLPGALPPGSRHNRRAAVAWRPVLPYLGRGHRSVVLGGRRRARRSSVIKKLGQRHIELLPRRHE